MLRFLACSSYSDARAGNRDIKNLRRYHPPLQAFGRFLIGVATAGTLQE